MLSKSKAETISYMIEKELSRVSLVDMCEYWQVTIEEFEEFLDYAFRYIDLKKQGGVENETN